MRRLFPGMALLLGLFCLAAQAQSFSGDREVEIVRTTFEVGNYREALKRGRAAMASQNFSEAQRIDLNKYVGMAAFILGDTTSAQAHLYSLLELNPDYVLDPFAFPPPAIKFFEELRKKNADALNLVRQKLALREEQLRREAADRLRAQTAAEEQRRRLEQLTAQMTVRTVERRSFLLNLVPFGAGQFQQGRNGLGVALASAEGVLGVTSIIAYLAIESLKVKSVTELKGIGGSVPYDNVGIPADRQAERDAWSTVKYVSGAAFYTLYAYGVVDAIYNHDDEVVTTERVPMPPAPEPSPAPVPVSAPPTGALAPPPRPFLFPTSGGVGAGMTLTF